MKRSFDAAQVPRSIALESVQVASPCHADWDAMRGDDRSRFCPSCAKNVYNLSAMTRPEAELLLQEKEGRLCVRFFQREDGTMLTQDCPVGVAALKQRSPSFALWAGVASLLVLVGALVSPSLMTGAHAQPDPHESATAAQTPTDTPEATTTATSEPQFIARMGDYAGPLPTPQPTVTPTSKPEGILVTGEMRVVATPTAPKAPPTSVPLMGKPSIPVSTPTPAPHAPRPRMGRIASIPSTPTPAPPPPEIRTATMGIVAMPLPPSHPAKKSAPLVKKTKTSTKKRR